MKWAEDSQRMKVKEAQGIEWVGPAEILAIKIKRINNIRN